MPLVVDQYCTLLCILMHMACPIVCGMCTDRCSGDFSQAKATKYSMNVPGLSSKAISDALADDITEAERAVAAQPGMYGRIWFGQALAFDEAYQILQEVNVHVRISRTVVCL